MDGEFDPPPSPQWCLLLRVAAGGYPPLMIDEPFFLTVAGISVSFAGFAGLMNALRRRGEAWEPMELYQLRVIVAYAIATLFAALAAIPVGGILGPHSAVQWLATAMLLVSVVLGLGNMRADVRLGRGTAVRTRVRASFAAITMLGTAAFFGAAITGAPQLYEVALVLMLAMPAGTFGYVVSRLDR